MKAQIRLSRSERSQVVCDAVHDVNGERKFVKWRETSGGEIIRRSEDMKRRFNFNGENDGPDLIEEIQSTQDTFVDLMPLLKEDDIDVIPLLYGPPPPRSLEHPEPVVGWLVCISGENRGEAYTLRTRHNSISSKLGTLVVSKTQISARRLMLVYDETDRTFLLEVSSDMETVLVNERQVNRLEVLVNRDKIQIGQIQFVFIAFCGEEFTWDENGREQENDYEPYKRF